MTSIEEIEVHEWLLTIMRERKQMDRDSMECWLHSVEAAKQHQSAFLQSLTKLTKYFKPRPKRPQTAGSPTSLHPTLSIDMLSVSDCSCPGGSSSEFDDDLTDLSSDIDPG